MCVCAFIYLLVCGVGKEDSVIGTDMHGQLFFLLAGEVIFCLYIYSLWMYIRMYIVCGYRSCMGSGFG